MLGDRRDMELIDRGALLFRLLPPVGGNIAKKRGFGMIGRYVIGRMGEEQIFSQPALLLRNGSEALEFDRG